MVCEWPGKDRNRDILYEIQSPATRLEVSPGVSFHLGLVMEPSYYAQGPCFYAVDDEDEVCDNSRTSCWRATVSEHMLPTTRRHCVASFLAGEAYARNLSTTIRKSHDWRSA
jgi:hypothetical protein